MVVSARERLEATERTRQAEAVSARERLEAFDTEFAGVSTRQARQQRRNLLAARKRAESRSAQSTSALSKYIAREGRRRTAQLRGREAAQSVARPTSLGDVEFAARAAQREGLKRATGSARLGTEGFAGVPSSSPQRIIGSDFVYTDPSGRSIGVSAALADKVRGDQYRERQRLSAFASVPVGTRSPTALGREIERRATPPEYIAVGGMEALIPSVRQARQGPPRPREVSAAVTRGRILVPGTVRIAPGQRTVLEAGEARVRMGGERFASRLERGGIPGEFGAGVVRGLTESPRGTALGFGAGFVAAPAFAVGARALAPRLATTVAGRALTGTGVTVSRAAVPLTLGAAGVTAVYPEQTGYFVGKTAPFAVGFARGAGAIGVGRITPLGDVATRAGVIQSRGGSFIVRGTQQQSFIRRGFLGDSTFTKVRPFGASIRVAPGISQVRYGKELTVLPGGFGVLSARPRTLAGFVKSDSVGSRALFAQGFPGPERGSRLATETLTGFGRPAGRGFFEAATGRTALSRGFAREVGAFQQAGGFSARPGRLRAGIIVGRGRFIGLQPAPSAVGFGPGSFVKPRLRAPRSVPRGRGFVSPAEFSPSVLRPVRSRAPSFAVGFGFGGAQRTGSVLGGAQLSSPRSLLGSRGLLRPGTITRGRLVQGFIQGPGTITRTGMGTALTPASGMSTISRLGLLTAPGLFPSSGGLGGGSGTPPPGGILGGPLPLFGLGGGGRSRGRGTPRSFSYSPSLSGFFVPASATPGRTATGLEVRPFIRRRRAKRRKKKT